MAPKILFLHGSGTNPDIFQFQSRKLAALLTPHFTLTYLPAPHPRSPGPGVLPFFAGCDPYLKWLSDETPQEEEEDVRLNWSDAGSGSGSGSGKGGLDWLVKEAQEKGPFVAVVGFSQGAKAGMYLVRRLEEMAREKGEASGEVKILVAVCGTAPFQGGGGVVAGETAEEGAARTRGWEESLGRGVVQVDSVHLIGEGDPWRGQSEKLVDCFKEGGRTVVRFKGEHMMPPDDGVNRRVAGIILNACQGGEV